MSRSANNLSNGRLVVAAPSQLRNFLQFTYSCWIKREATLTGDGYLIHLLNQKHLYVDSTNRIHFKIEQSVDPLGITTDANTVPLNEWINIAVTADSRELHLYVSDLEGNWREEGTFSGGGGTLLIDSLIDSYFLNDSSGAKPFPGSMAEVGIWNRVLTATELQQLAVKRYTPSLISTNLRGAWRLAGDNPEVDSVYGNNATPEPSNTALTITDPPPLILLTAPSDISSVTVYAPNITSPVGGEVYNRGTIDIEWDIKDPPTSRADLTLGNVTYELEYTENYVGRESDWHTLRRRISGQDTGYTWTVGRMLKSDSIRIRVRSFCESINLSSEWSPSAENFSVNVFKLTPPSILSPMDGRTYSEYISIVLEEDHVINTYNQKVRYKLEYQSEKADVDWTTLYEDLPVGSSPIRWNIDGLSAANDYQLKLTASDPNSNQHAVVYVRNLNISQPGLFYIDTKPPDGVMQFETQDQITNVLDQIINLYLEDEVTGVKSMALRERNLTSGGNLLVTLGQILDENMLFDPVQTQSDCGTFSAPFIDYVPKLNWSLMRDVEDVSRSGLIKVEAKLKDYGENDSCIGQKHLFLPLWEPGETLTDMIILKETREVITAITAEGVETESKAVNVAYISTILGKLYRIEPYPTLSYDLGQKISKLAEFSSNVYVCSYNSSTDVASFYRDDKTTDLTLITQFTDPLSEITAVGEFDEYLFLGMKNGQLWRFDGAAFSRIRTFDNAITSLLGDSRYLYIGFFGGTLTSLYTGTTFVNLDIEV